MRVLKLIVAPLLWGGTLLGALSLHNFAALNVHSVCGPWGCGPPTNALIALHGAWSVVLWPTLAVVANRFWTSKTFVRRLGIFCVIFGVLGITSISLWQLFYWWPQQSEFTRGFLLHRCGFAIVTTTDVPVVEVLLAGIGLLVIRRWCGQTQTPALETNQATAQTATT